jgi:hypothetical protein
MISMRLFEVWKKCNNILANCNCLLNGIQIDVMNNVVVDGDITLGEMLILLD